jgi:hypothetical protein
VHRRRPVGVNEFESIDRHHLWFFLSRWREYYIIVRVPRTKL